MKQCVCKPGYRGDGESCEKIDPCEKCHEKAYCKGGAYSGNMCVCKPDYEGDGENCTPKPDPCDKCDSNADCIGSSYSNKTCKCKPGWVGDGFVCKKYDPCDKCPNYTKCVAGKCVCKDNGYYYQNNDCKDKDECKLGYHNCHKHATCTNTVGGFKCKCKSGFTGDGVSCKKNYDPCNDCHKNAECVMSSYGSKCVCKEGYSGNGQICDYEQKENYPEPTRRPYGQKQTGVDLSIYTKLKDGQCSLMGYDWENEARLVSAMKWVKGNGKTYANMVGKIMEEFGNLGKAVLQRSASCTVSKAGAVPCKHLYFPHTDTRCQFVQRLKKVYDDVAEHCNDQWKQNFGGMVSTLVQNNMSGKQGAPCDPVNWL